MKTISEYLAELEEPYRSRALINRKEDRSRSRFTDNEKMFDGKTVAEALIAGFCWEQTPEGDKYWRDLYDNLANSDIL